MRVICYSQSNKRGAHIARAMYDGLRRRGVDARLTDRFEGVKGDVAVAYGWLAEGIFKAYRAAGGHYVFWDLGYWGRRPNGNPQDGFHRVAVDSWDTAASMLRNQPSDRFRASQISPLLHARPSTRVILAGMSDKAAKTHGYHPGQWEDAMRKRLDEMGANVLFRGKPNKRQAAAVPIEIELQDAKLLVTHHSNAALDALLAGVPAFAIKGVGALLSPAELTRDMLESPSMPTLEQRLELFADVAYAQWTPPEMRSGAAWEYIEKILCG